LLRTGKEWRYLTPMKRWPKAKLAFSVLMGILLASALVVSLLSGFPSRSQAAASTGNLHVFDHVTATSARYITIGTRDDPRGNYVVFFDPVFDATDTHQIGSDTGICTVTSKTVQTCQITFIFPDGEIAVQGPQQLLSGAASTMIAVGGTGIYKGKEGPVTSSHQVKEPTGLEFAFVFHFS
jgi:hypothetical protein